MGLLVESLESSTNSSNGSSIMKASSSSRIVGPSDAAGFGCAMKTGFTESKLGSGASTDATGFAGFATAIASAITMTPRTPSRIHGTYATDGTEWKSGEESAESVVEECGVSTVRRERMDGSSHDVEASESKVDVTSKPCWETAKSLRHHEGKRLQCSQLDPLWRRGLGGRTVEGDYALNGGNDGR